MTPPPNTIEPVGLIYYDVSSPIAAATVERGIINGMASKRDGECLRDLDIGAPRNEYDQWLDSNYLTLIGYGKNTTNGKRSLDLLW
jgi:hypothetical protein